LKTDTPAGKVELDPVAPKKTAGGLNWKAVLGILISGGLLYYAFRGQPLGGVATAIRNANIPLLLLATAVATSVFWIRAWRWRAILDPIHDGTTFRSRFAAVNIGFMANNVLPARVGEFARAYAISRLEPVPVVAGLSSLVIERLFDALTLVAQLFVAMALPGFPAWPANAEMDFPGIAQRLGIFVALGGIALFLLVLWPRPTVRAFEAVANRVLPKRVRRPVVDALEAFLTGAGILRNGRLMAEVGAWSVVLWIVNATAFWIAMHAFGINVSFVGAVFFNSCLAFVVAVPAAPGFVGTYELAHVLVLTRLWGYDQGTVLGYALGFHLAAFIPVTLMGLYYANRLGLSLSGMSHTEEVVEEAVEEVTGMKPGT
jgi:glycosyltransferase 2 family protein